MIFAIILLLYFLISCFSNKFSNDSICFLCMFFLIKWITNYRKCTFSYIECKLRGVKKEEGIIYNIMEDIYDINKSDYRYCVYVFILYVFYIHYNKLNN